MKGQMTISLITTVTILRSRNAPVEEYMELTVPPLDRAHAQALADGTADFEVVPGAPAGTYRLVIKE